MIYWEQRKLISCLSLLKDGTHGTHKDYPSGPLLLSAKNIKNGRVNYDETDRRISYKDFEKIHSNFKLQVGDVLLTIVGSIGETALLQNTFGITFQRSVAFLRVTDNIIPEFLMSEINTSRFKNELENRKSTSAQPGIYLENLGEIPVFISKNSDEQLKIGSYFDSLNHLITLHQSKSFWYILKSIVSCTLYWEQRKLGEVANRFDSTRIPISENLRVSGKTPYYGANGIQDYVDGYTHDGEYVLIAEDGANDLKNYPIRLVKGRIWVNNHAHVIQGMEKFMNNQFINFAMSQVDFESIVVGCGRAKLNAEQLMDICFKIPNKNEQANIGRLFESINHLITLHQLEPFQLIFKAIAYRIIDYAKSKPLSSIK